MGGTHAAKLVTLMNILVRRRQPRTSGHDVSRPLVFLTAAGRTSLDIRSWSGLLYIFKRAAVPDRGEEIDWGVGRIKTTASAPRSETSWSPCKDWYLEDHTVGLLIWTM